MQPRHAHGPPSRARVEPVAEPISCHYERIALHTVRRRMTAVSRYQSRAAFSTSARIGAITVLH